jgi:hypothetical protein
VSPQRESTNGNSAIETQTNTNPGSELSNVRKPFVEPQISMPVDVLEATAFFQQTTVSGAGLTP